MVGLGRIELPSHGALLRGAALRGPRNAESPWHREVAKGFG